MRRVVAQALALGQGFVHEPDLALLQVAQAAVGQLRGLRRRARREVVALDERGAQAAGGGVEGRAHPGDAAADDEDVERVVAEAAKAFGAVEPRGAVMGWRSGAETAASSCDPTARPMVPAECHRTDRRSVASAPLGESARHCLPTMVVD